MGPVTAQTAMTTSASTNDHAWPTMRDVACANLRNSSSIVLPPYSQSGRCLGNSGARSVGGPGARERRDHPAELWIVARIVGHAQGDPPDETAIPLGEQRRDRVVGS